MVPEPKGSDELPDSFIGQLSLTLKYQLSEALKAIGESSQWCPHPDEISDCLTFIQGCEATVLVAELIPEPVRLRFQDAE